MNHKASKLTPDPIATRDMQAAVAKALAGRFSVSATISSLNWLPSEAYRVAAKARTDDVEKPAADAVESWIQAGIQARPETRPVFHAGSAQLHRDYLQTVTADAEYVEQNIRFAIADETIEYRSSLARAQKALFAIWPEAAAELALLVREIVVVADTDLTASHDSMFGCIFIGTEMLSNETEALEALLHEGGHTALYLRLMFARFLDNPEQLASHPLRPDPRPLSGVLHAGFVLSRIVEGLTRWEKKIGIESPEYNLAVERCQSARERLDATLTALDANAAWTSAGLELRQTLGATQESFN